MLYAAKMSNNFYSEKMRKKKGTGRVEGKRKILRKKENTGNCPFENIGFYLVI